MPSKKHLRVTDAAIAAARERAEETRRKIAHTPPSELLTPQEQADAAPFYFVLREYIRQLKETREKAGLTLADISAKTGMAVEYLSRLETGAQTNPTWKTLGAYANALGRRPQLVLEASASQPELPRVDLTSVGPTVLVSPAGTSVSVLRIPDGIAAEPMKPVLELTRKASPRSDGEVRRYRPDAKAEPPVTLQLEELVG
jgi:transcriptional regulator with XRE-family HTH domain